MFNKTIFPLVKDFREVNIVRAFLMAAILLAFVTATTTEVRHFLDEEEQKLFGYETKNMSDWVKWGITLVASFCVALFFYLIYHFSFAYGGGMIAKENCNKKGVCKLPPGTLFVGKSMWDQIKKSLTVFPFKYARKSRVAKRVKQHMKLFKT
jgi:hypothetical protein